MGQGHHHHRAQADDRKVAHLPAGGAAQRYAPAVERRAAVVSETRSFLRRICRESVSMLTNAAAEPERLSREEIDALYDVLKGLEEKEHG